MAAWRGEASLARGLMDTVAREAARYSQGYQLVFAGDARFVLELGLGRYREAYASLGGQIGDTSQLKFALADMIEAAVRCGEPGAAHELLGRLAALAAVSPVRRTLGDLARARALLANDEDDAEADAERLYLEAIDHHEHTRGPAHQALSHQVHGEWLRRERRAKEARHHLLRRAPTCSVRWASGASAAWGGAGAVRRWGTGAATADRWARWDDLIAAGGPGRPPGRPGADQRRDRDPALSQRQHRRLPPAQGVQGNSA